MEEDFLDTIPNDERFKHVRVIVVNVPCSKSGIVNPVDFVLQEGVSGSVKDLAKGNLDSSKVKGMAFQHLSILKHAMKFPLIQGIIYTTRSCHEAENIQVVKKALEESREEQTREKSFFDLTHVLPDFAKALLSRSQSANGVSPSVSLTRRGK